MDRGRWDSPREEPRRNRGWGFNRNDDRGGHRQGGSRREYSSFGGRNDRRDFGDRDSRGDFSSFGSRRDRGGYGGGSRDFGDRGDSYRNRHRDDRYDGGFGSRRDRFREERRPLEVGTIVSLKNDFGFIAWEKGDDDLFFHFSEVRGLGDGELEVGDEMEFEVVAQRRDRDKQRAQRVRLRRKRAERQEELLKDVKPEKGIIFSVNSRDKRGRIRCVDRAQNISFQFVDIITPATKSSRKASPVREHDCVEFYPMPESEGVVVAVRVKLLPPGSVSFEEEYPSRVNGTVVSVVKPPPRRHQRRRERPSFRQRSSSRGDESDGPSQEAGVVHVVATDIPEWAHKIDSAQIVVPEFEELDEEVTDVGKWADATESNSTMAPDLVAVPFHFDDETSVVGDVTLRRDDRVRVTLVRHKQTNRVRATLVTLETPNPEGREMGVVAAIKDSFGFVKSPDHKDDLFFHLSEVVVTEREAGLEAPKPPSAPETGDGDNAKSKFKSGDVRNRSKSDRKRNISIRGCTLRLGDEVSFDASKREDGNGTGGRSKMSASRLVLLPRGTVKWETLVAADVEAVVSKPIASARSSSFFRNRDSRRREESNKANTKGRLKLVLTWRDDDVDDTSWPEEIEFASRDLEKPQLKLNARDRVVFDLSKTKRSNKFIVQRVRLVERAPREVRLEGRFFGEVERNIIKGKDGRIQLLGWSGATPIEDAAEVCGDANKAKASSTSATKEEKSKKEPESTLSAKNSTGPKGKSSRRRSRRRSDSGPRKSGSIERAGFVVNCENLPVLPISGGKMLNKFYSFSKTATTTTNAETEADMETESETASDPLELYLGDLVEFDVEEAVGGYKRALDVRLVRRKSKVLGTVVSIKSHFGFLTRVEDETSKGGDAERIYFATSEVRDKKSLRVGDIVKFSEVLVVGPKNVGTVRRAVDVRFEKRRPRKKKEPAKKEQRPDTKRLNMLLRKSGNGVGFVAATRQAKGPDGTLGFASEWRPSRGMSPASVSDLKEGDLNA